MVKVISAEEIERAREEMQDDVCELCGGTGEIPTDIDDGEGHIMQGVGTEICPCKRRTKDEDDINED